MSGPAPSYEKVHYALRPAKQVERRMFVDLFQNLMSIGFPISDYHYVGMGSVYFVDFSVFHRYLGISRLTSVEKKTSAKSRLDFNKPFDLIDIKIGDISNYICSMSSDKKYILWLDYDCVLDRDVVKAVKLAIATLSPGSVFILTVDAMPPGETNDGPKEWMHHFEDEAGQHLWDSPVVKDFSRDNIVKANIKTIANVIDSGIVGREEVQFSPLLNIWYADGHEMLTIGGMVTSPADRNHLKRIDKDTLRFIRTRLTASPYRIKVPLLTHKEKLHLDTMMPLKKTSQKPRFIKQKDLNTYDEIYRYYPSYTEMYL